MKTITNLCFLFEDSSFAKFPERTALQDGTLQFSFRQVEQYSKRCATLLIQRANCICEPIAVYLPKSASVIFADLGIIYSGNIYTNLDIKSPPQRLHSILKNIEPRIVITNRNLAPDLISVGCKEEKIFYIEDIENPIFYDSKDLLSRLDRLIDTDPLCIINTSGSTGIPKGVVLHHRGMLDFMTWVFETFDFESETKFACLSPIFFDHFGMELALCLTKGATMVLIPENLATFPVQLLTFLQDHGITFIFWVPSIMVTIANLDLLDKYPLPSLKRIFFAGETFPTRHFNKWRRYLPLVQFVNLYGPTEIHVDCTYFIVNRPFSGDEPLPIGYPCRNSSILILNEHNQEASSGESGELCVRGTSLSHGYWNDAERTTKVFVQNPLNKNYQELIYRTGDQAKINERGEILLIGRKDFQIKHMGYRIELQEIENQVLSIDGIGNACVVYNQQRKEITLFYECISDPISEKNIRRALVTTLPKYMLPTAYHLMARLPLNQNGKIDRNALSLIATDTR